MTTLTRDGSDLREAGTWPALLECVSTSGLRQYSSEARSADEPARAELSS